MSGSAVARAGSALGRKGALRRLPGWAGRRLSAHAIAFAARRRLARVAAELLCAEVRVLSRADPGVARPVVALTLPKPGFTEDVECSIAQDPRFTVLALRREVPKAIAAPFLPPLVDDNTYGMGLPAIEAGRGPLRAFWRDVWRLAGPRLGVDVVLTGNFAYYAEQEMAAALEELGTPFVTLMKENLKTPGLEAFYEDLYRHRRLPFAGSLIATYNEVERAIQVRAGSFPADGIHVVGMPRLDAVHARRRADAGSRREGAPRVLFMSFGENSGSPFISRKGHRGPELEQMPPELEAVQWPRLVEACHGAIVRLAEQRPDLDVVLKAKNSARSLDLLERQFGAGFRPPANLRLIAGGDPGELIAGADVLCGFNSTTVLEGVAADVPVVVPAFAEAAEPALQPFVLGPGGGCDRPASAESLVETLAQRADERRPHRADLPAEPAAVLRHWLGNDDGRAGARVADTLYAHARARRRAA